MAAGDFKIMRNASNIDAVPDTGSDLLLLWDTAVDNQGTNITYASGTFTLGETGKFLVICSDYISTTDTTNNERFNFKMTLNLDGSELLEGHTAEYIRKSGGNQGAIQTSIAIIDVTTTTGTGDELQVRTERTDNSTTGTANRVSGDRSGISIIKLDDDANFGLYRSSAGTVASTTNDAAVTLNIQTEDQEDSPFTRTTNTVDIATNNLVLAIYSLQCNTAQGRAEYQGRLTLGGTPVPGSYGHVYKRNTDTTIWGGCSAAVLLEPTSGDDLELEIVSRELGGGTFTNTLQLIELPSGAEAAIMEATTGNFNVAATDFTWDTLPYIDTAAFTATAGNANIDVDNADDYIVIAGQAATSYTAANRSTPAMQFRVNTTDIETGGRSSYVRGNVTAGHGTMNTATLLNGLSANDSIYVRNDYIGTLATTVNNESGAFSVIRLSSLFATPGAPTVTTQAVSSIDENTATGNGNITDLGSPNPTAHGVCWDTSSGPTTADDSTDEGGASATGAFTSNMTGLLANTLYYVRAYATNTSDTSYGSEVTFTTLGEPTVTTQSVSSIDTTTATGNGNITDLGNPDPTAHGVCWSTSTSPDINDDKTDEGSSSATGAFTSNITGLSPGVLYYVRAYATNSQGTVYGTQVSFASYENPTITTQAVSSIDQNTATGNGNITDLGEPDPTAHGVCWDTSPTPTTSDDKTDEGSASVTGAFTTNMTGLIANTLYYVRAYATNASDTVYGTQVSFTTLGEPTVTTQSVSLIDENTATGNGNITDLGNPDPTAYGVCWDTSSGPTTADDSTDEGSASATGTFTSNMTGLLANTLYYVRAYATNSEGTVYGGEVTFTTLGVSTVTTQAVSSIEDITATGNGNITDLGNPNPTAHGVCWSTSTSPDINDDKTDEGSSSSTGAFTSNMTGLISGTLYYVRSYATNSQGTVYGNQVSFTTKTPTVPTITTQAATSITNNTAVGNGNITDLGYPNPTAHGMCWNTTGSPTTSDDTSNEGSASATGAFTSNMISLISGTTYYVRAYVINSQGTVYGSQTGFTTSDTPATVGMQLASADKTLSSSGSENPGTFNFDESLPWGAITIALKQSNVTTNGTKFTTVETPILILSNYAKISDVTIKGNVVVDSVIDLNNLIITGDMHISNAGIYNFSDVTVIGDTTNTDSGGNVRIIGTDGTNVTTTEPGTGNDEVDIQIISTTTLINLKDNTEIRVYDAGTTNEVGGIEIAIDGTTDNRRFSFEYNVDSYVDIVVFNVDYSYERLDNYKILAEDSELPFQQEIDVNYLNT